jgi:transcriptional regulator with XRE-family HTH domain
MSRNLVGTEVRRKRCEKNWSQERLADECQDMGWNVTRGHIAKIESGEVHVSDVDHLVLAAALDVDMEDLMPRVCVNVKRKKGKGSQSLFVVINEHTGGCLKAIMSPDEILANKSNKLLNGHAWNGHKTNGHEICPPTGQPIRKRR